MQLELFEVPAAAQPPQNSVGRCATAAQPRSTGPRLRPYQQAAVDGIFQSLESYKSTIAVLPTGTGKTVLFSEVAKRWPGRIMVLAHRRELLDQAQDKLEHATGEKTSLEQGSNRAFNMARLIVASKDSLHEKRLTRFGDVSLLIIDEAHRSVGKSYTRVVDHLRAKNPELRLLGVTATPKRHDKKAMGMQFEDVAFQYEIHDAIGDGWLVPLASRIVHLEGLDLSECRTTAGDLNGKDLALAVEKEKVVQGYADAIVREGAGRNHIMAFCASVAQTEQLASILDRHNAGRVEWVCGDAQRCHPEKRIMVSRDFREGRIRFLVNCGVYLEGFDAPFTDMIAMCRPTKSLPLFTQMAGRGSRPIPGLVDAFETPDERRAAIAASAKPDCLILDFVDNSRRHKLISSVDILGGRFPQQVQEDVRREVEKKGRSANLEEEYQLAQEREEKRQAMLKAHNARLVARAKYRTENVNVFDGNARANGWHRPQPRGVRMPFGKHKGKMVGELSNGYLTTLFSKQKITSTWLRNGILNELSARKIQIPSGANDDYMAQYEEVPF